MQATMKRSTTGIMYVTPSDFELVLRGLKTATSRAGDRREFWPVGKEIAVVDNQDESRFLPIEVVYNFVTTLDDVTPTQAGNIGGGYSLEDHATDFMSVYPDSDSNTELSVVGFRVLPYEG